MTVDLAEIMLTGALNNAGWTWERIAPVYGRKTRQAMRHHRRRCLS